MADGFIYGFFMNDLDYLAKLKVIFASKHFITETIRIYVNMKVY